MARIRTVKPEYWTSEQVMNISRDARLLFIGMWNYCDDGGNHPASPKTLKAEVLPGDEDVTSDRVLALVDEMIEQDLVEEYEVEGKTYWHVTGWRHQRIDQPTYRHPTGDTGDAGDAQVTRVTKNRKRIGGKQRQILLKKLRERDGDACHLCGDTSSLSLFSSASENDENPHEISLLRLICPTCKRVHKPYNGQGDAKIEQVTQVTQIPLDGDSLTEGKGREGNGEEGKGSLSPSQAAQGASIEVGDADDRCAAQIRIGEILQHLRKFGINTSTNVIEMHAWTSNPKATNDLIDAAVAKARQTKPSGVIHLNYLKPIIEELLDPPAPKPKPADDWAWKRSDSGIDRKGKEIGMHARPTESYRDYADRIEAEIRKRQGGKAA